jgi:hypothetical protein
MPLRFLCLNSLKRWESSCGENETNTTQSKNKTNSQAKAALVMQASFPQPATDA